MKDQLTADMVSKGHATDMISKIKFGAKGWFGEMEGDKKRKVKQADTLKEREQVRVGPLPVQPASRQQSRSPTPGLTLRQALVGAMETSV